PDAGPTGLTPTSVARARAAARCSSSAMNSSAYIQLCGLIPEAMIRPSYRTRCPAHRPGTTLACPGLALGEQSRRSKRSFRLRRDDVVPTPMAKEHPVMGITNKRAAGHVVSDAAGPETSADADAGDSELGSWATIVEQHSAR